MAENQSVSSGYRSVHGNEGSLSSSLHAQDDHQHRPQSAQEFLQHVTDLCCRCGHLERKSVATHICLTCSMYGRYFCGMCLREHNFFCNNHNHDVRSLSSEVKKCDEIGLITEKLKEFRMELHVHGPLVQSDRRLDDEDDTPPMEILKQIKTESLLQKKEMYMKLKVMAELFGVRKRPPRSSMRRVSKQTRLLFQEMETLVETQVRGTQAINGWIEQIDRAYEADVINVRLEQNGNEHEHQREVLQKLATKLRDFQTENKRTLEELKNASHVLERENSELRRQLHELESHIRTACKVNEIQIDQEGVSNTKSSKCLTRIEDMFSSVLKEFNEIGPKFNNHKEQLKKMEKRISEQCKAFGLPQTTASGINSVENMFELTLKELETSREELATLKKKTSDGSSTKEMREKLKAFQLKLDSDGPLVPSGRKVEKKDDLKTDELLKHIETETIRQKLEIYTKVSDLVNRCGAKTKTMAPELNMKSVSKQTSSVFQEMETLMQGTKAIKGWIEQLGKACEEAAVINVKLDKTTEKEREPQREILERIAVKLRNSQTENKKLTSVNTNAKKMALDIIKSSDKIWKQLSKGDISTDSKARDVDSLLESIGVTLNTCDEELHQLSVTLDDSIQIVGGVSEQSGRSKKPTPTEHNKHPTLLQQSEHIKKMLQTWKKDGADVWRSIDDLEKQVTMIYSSLTADPYNFSQSEMRFKDEQHPKIFRPLFEVVFQLNGSVDKNKKRVAANHRNMLDKGYVCRRQEQLIEELRVEKESLTTSWKKDGADVWRSIDDLEKQVTMIYSSLTADPYNFSQSEMRFKDEQHPKIFRPLFEVVFQLNGSVDKNKKRVAANHRNMLDKEYVCRRQEQLIEELRVEKESLTTRLSKVVGAKLRENNPNVADLSDSNRPTKLSETYSELYDNQWTDAFDILIKDQGLSEENAISTLLNVILESFRICEKVADTQLSTLRRTLLQPTTGLQFEELNSPNRPNKNQKKRGSASSEDGNGGDSGNKLTGNKAAKSFSESSKQNSTDDNRRAGSNEDDKAKASPGSRQIVLPAVESTMIYNMRKGTADLSITDVMQHMTHTYEEWFEDGTISSYAKRCIELCWQMNMQTPPLHMDVSGHQGQPFNADRYKAYTKSGRKVDYIVWPAVNLYTGGPLLNKGVAQGMQ